MKKNISHIKSYFDEIGIIADQIDYGKINDLVKSLIKIRKNKGRVFFIGVGGSAGNCSHAVNDFRKICNIESYTPTDNVSELTARINDDGWNGAFVGWLKTSKLNFKDAVFIFSVGGGNMKKNVSVNIIKAIQFAKRKKSKVLGVVGNDGGYTKKYGDVVIKVPLLNKKFITPCTESYQSVIWHCLVSHPLLQKNKTKW